MIRIILKEGSAFDKTRFGFGNETVPDEPTRIHYSLSNRQLGRAVMAPVSGSPDSSKLLVRKSVGSNPTVVIDYIFCLLFL